MNINLEYYKIFYTVAKTCSITLAAKELCISQPAVSQSIKLLEQECNMALFTRNTKGVKLTRAGELLYEHVSVGYETILLGEKKLNELTNLDTGELWIGASDMTLQFYLLPYLEEYHQLYPNIKVHITNAPTPDTINHLYAGRIDFGLVTGPLPESERLSYREVRELEDIFIAGPKFIELKDKVLSYKDLVDLPIICLEENTSTRSYVDHFLLENDAHLSPEFELATSDMIVSFVKRNLGIGSVMSDFAQPQIANGDVFKLNFDKSIPSRKMYIINDKKVAMSVAAQKLLELL